MTNKTLGTGLFVVMGGAFVWAIIEHNFFYSASESVWMLLGIGYIFFGIWGAIRLREKWKSQNTWQFDDSDYDKIPISKADLGNEERETLEEEARTIQEEIARERRQEIEKARADERERTDGTREQD